MPQLRPIARFSEPRSAMDIEDEKLFRVALRARRDDVISTRTRQPINGGYGGSKVGAATQVRGGTVG